MRIFDLEFIRSNPLFLLPMLFHLWMLIHAVRNQEWIWAAFMFIFPFGFNAILYYFMVYRSYGGTMRGGFELPGAARRERIQDLKAKIHHLDKAHHHAELGDVYFAQNNYAEAEKSYRAALEREPNDLDTRSHFAQCLLRTKRAADALPLLEHVCGEIPDHDYGYTRMAWAEALAATGDKQKAIQVWRTVLENHSYARAKVQLAELLIDQKEYGPARSELQEALADDAHVPKFQRKRDRVWTRRAKGMLKRIPT